MLVYRRQIKSKWNLSTSSIPLEFLPNDEVSLIMENKKIAELIKEDVEVLEFGAPRLSKVDKSQRPRLFHKNVHIFIYIAFKKLIL